MITVFNNVLCHHHHDSIEWFVVIVIGRSDKENRGRCYFREMYRTDDLVAVILCFTGLTLECLS